MMGKLGQMMGLGGGMPMPSPEQIEEMQKQVGGALPPRLGRPARHSLGAPARRLQPAPAIPRLRLRRPETAGARRKLQSIRGEEEVARHPHPVAGRRTFSREREKGRSPSPARRRGLG